MKVNAQILDGFQPIKLEIILETKREMEDLLARVNISANGLNSLNENDNWVADSESAQALFDLLHDEWARRGYDSGDKM
jgi:hypothetical protein